MKHYLLDTFHYNDHANKLALAKIRELPEKDESIRFFSHLINSMNKWLGRIEKWGEDMAFPDNVVLPVSTTPSDEASATPPNQGGELGENHPVGETPAPLLGQEGSYLTMDWWLPVYELNDLEGKWDECLKRWLDFIESKTEEELFVEVEWHNPDLAPTTPSAEAAATPPLAGGEPKANFAAVIKDIALQLNYHSIHHRAQIQYLIRQQGIEPDFVDYIGTKYRKLS